MIKNFTPAYILMFKVILFFHLTNYKDASPYFEQGDASFLFVQISILK